ncbi:MAG: DUF1254 domain-containing protein [Sphingopyxis sp.]|nr:DUF1254 domain-containing protein [Sphingopyxis sp.]
MIYAMPLIENAASRAASFANEGAVPNRVFHDRKLATPAFRSVTSPNNDTLYSRAWIDLGGGPVTIEVPSMGDRYHSVAFMDMYGNNFAVLGSRTTGDAGGRYTLVGPRDGRTDFHMIQSPTNAVWMLVRTLIDGEADLPAVHALQDGIKVSGPERPVPGSYATRKAPWAALLDTIQRLIVENAPPVTDELLFARLAPLGIRPDGGFDASRFSDEDAKMIAAGLDAGRARLAGPRRQGAPVNNWAYPKANCGIYGEDYLYRGQVALGGLGALPRVEAMYMRAIGPGGNIYFPSGQGYRMRFESGGMPAVNGFWSLTMYERADDGRFFLIDNPIARYAIGDRTPGLRYASDGSLELTISADRPATPDRASNWLPAPSGKNWGVVFRAYLPKDELLTGDYRLPPLERAAAQ